MMPVYWAVEYSGIRRIGNEGKGDDVINLATSVRQ